MKVGIVGMGWVGASVAISLLQSGFAAEVLVCDVKRGPGRRRSHGPCSRRGVLSDGARASCPARRIGDFDVMTFVAQESSGLPAARVIDSRNRCGLVEVEGWRDELARRATMLEAARELGQLQDGYPDPD